MSLQTILDAILDAGEVEVRQIKEQAAVKGREIQANNLQEAQQAQEEACRDASALVGRVRARTIQHARLEALQVLGGVREALIDDVLEKTGQQLHQLRASSDYPAVLHKLIREALTELSEKPSKSRVRANDERAFYERVFDEKVHIEADPRDKELVLKILDEFGINPSISYGLKCWGGIIARSKDNRIVVINTVEARLERATPYLRSYLAAFFESSEEEIPLIRTGEGGSV